MMKPRYRIFFGFRPEYSKLRTVNGAIGHYCEPINEEAKNGTTYLQWVDIRGTSLFHGNKPL